MRTLFSLVLIGITLLLAACGSGTQTPPPQSNLVITSPTANSAYVTGSPVIVQGTAPEGSQVSVRFGGGTPVAAEMLSVEDDRQRWRAEVLAPAIGSHTITASAATPDEGTLSASVAVNIVELQPYGGWQGLFNIDRRPTGGELTEGGTMIVWYGSKWFRMYFAHAGIEVEGTTDGWDLVDVSGWRMTGTYHAVGETNEFGHVMDEPWIDFVGVLDSGEIITATVTLD